MFVPFLAYTGAGFAFIGSFLSLLISFPPASRFVSGLALSHLMGK
jgi:hypothetical protein